MWSNVSHIVAYSCKSAVFTDNQCEWQEVTQVFAQGSKKMNFLEDGVKRKPNWTVGDKSYCQPMCCANGTKSGMLSLFPFILPVHYKSLGWFACKLHLGKHPKWC